MIKLKVNGVTRQHDGDPDMPLLWYLRDDLDLKEPWPQLPGHEEAVRRRVVGNTVEDRLGVVEPVPSH